MEDPEGYIPAAANGAGKTAVQPTRRRDDPENADYRSYREGYSAGRRDGAGGMDGDGGSGGRTNWSIIGTVASAIVAWFALTALVVRPIEERVASLERGDRLTAIERVLSVSASDEDLADRLKPLADTIARLERNIDSLNVTASARNAYVDRFLTLEPVIENQGERLQRLEEHGTDVARDAARHVSGLQSELNALRGLVAALDRRLRNLENRARLPGDDAEAGPGHP